MEYWLWHGLFRPFFKRSGNLRPSALPSHFPNFFGHLLFLLILILHLVPPGRLLIPNSGTIRARVRTSQAQAVFRMDDDAVGTAHALVPTFGHLDLVSPLS